MAVLVLQGAQDVLQQQWKGGGQGSQSLGHLGVKAEQALSAGEGRRVALVIQEGMEQQELQGEE